MMSIKKFLVALCLIFAFIPPTNSKLLLLEDLTIYDEHVEIDNDYIRKYLPLAKRCSKLYGIPVSICLSQAIYESGFGKSELAKKTNNHFGMKKGKSIQETFAFLDDDTDKKGNLVKSKFRKYYSAADSFHDYGRMMSNSKRFAHLFKIPASNYTAWAKGLQQSGYATNPAYALQLIRIIKKYKLYRLEKGLGPKS